MHTVEVLLKRRSIRKFKQHPVPWDNVVSMLTCAINAPCAGNIFNTKFIVVNDKSAKKALAEACYNQAWMSQAPLLIALTSEPEIQKRYYGTRGELFYSTQNTASCAMSMIAAAESLGLGTCWVGSFDEDKLRSIFGLPEYVNVHIILAVGFPDEQPKPPRKPWIRTVTYLEKWWAARRPAVAPYGYYSQHVMKATRNANDAIKKVVDMILKKPEKEQEDKKPKEKESKIDYETEVEGPEEPKEGG